MVLRMFILGLVAMTGILVLACEDGEPPRKADGSIDGAQIYKKNCRSCHGSRGDAGTSGAADLRTSSLSTDEMYKVIKFGRGQMMEYKSLLSDEEIDAVIEHIRTLQK